MIRKFKSKKSDPEKAASPPPPPEPPAREPSPGPVPVTSYGSPPGSPTRIPLPPRASAVGDSRLGADFASSRQVTVVEPLDDWSDADSPTRRTSRWSEKRHIPTGPADDPFEIKPSESASNVGLNTAPVRRTRTSSRLEGFEEEEEEEEIYEEEVESVAPAAAWQSASPHRLHQPSPVRTPMSQTLQYAATQEAAARTNRVRFQSPTNHLLSPQTASRAATMVPFSPGERLPPDVQSTPSATDSRPPPTTPRPRHASAPFVPPPSPPPPALNPNARWKTWAAEVSKLPKTALPGGPPNPPPEVAAAIVAAQPLVIPRGMTAQPYASGKAATLNASYKTPYSHTMKAASMGRSASAPAPAPPMSYTTSAGTTRTFPASSASRSRAREFGQRYASTGSSAEEWGDEWEDEDDGNKHTRYGSRTRKETIIPGSSSSYSPTTPTHHESSSKTMAYASAASRAGPIVLSERRNRHGMRVVDACGASLASARRALFGEDRPAEERLHWAYNPNKDPRVRNTIAWMHSLAHDIAHLGLLHFLRSKERGALFANADHREREEGDFGLDWLTYSELQHTLDQTLQECDANYDPGEMVIVFIFLLSKTGNSMAIWRRKIAVPPDLKAKYASEVSALKASLRKESIHVDRLDSELGELTPMVVTPGKGKGKERGMSDKPEKKRGLLKRLFKRSSKKRV